MDIDLTQAFRSHPKKLLQDHLRDVARKVVKRSTDLPIILNFKTAEIAALFHDLGKINPNFQRKLNGIKKGYTGHSYLSALAWFCFLQTNQTQVQQWFEKPERVFSVAAMIARHHGDLPNLADGIFNQQPFDDLQKFLAEEPDLPISNFLQLLMPHTKFALSDNPLHLKSIFDKARWTPRENQLAYFLETQFGFACLLESDKRDAGNNEVYKREILKPYFKQHFASQLTAKIERIGQEAKEKPSNTELNLVRTQMREEAVANLKPQLQQNKRVFTLAAPTGAGKTLMLLSLAQEILAHNPELNVIYALPFLSITEQVEKICHDIFANFREVEEERFKDEVAVLRFDSRSENKRIEWLQEQLETDQSEELLAQLLQENFSAETFDHPFIVTTFVQVFETLVSNRNATLLRLPNFTHSIFLLDEIQALPARLYVFFTALLDEFCRQFDSYAIISTATMPYLELTPKTHVTNLPADQRPELLFVDYQRPAELSNSDHFNAPVFNRYRITKETHISTLELLAEQICDRDESCLVILNTIDDTKQLYKTLQSTYGTDECVLLNTHFTLNDRRTKLKDCQQRLQDKEKIILVSTQLIEAGVDIDFPVLYRDLCPLPNLIQSAGRCNRNGKLTCGEVHFIALRRGNGKILSAQMIYRGKDKVLLDFGREQFPAVITEGEMKSLQQAYFEFIGKNLTIGEHEQTNAKLQMVQHINKAEFETLGKFRLIDEREFGEEFRYFIPQNEDDSRFEDLANLANTKRGKSFAEAKQRQIAIESKLREMSGDIVQFRLPVGKSAPSFSDEKLGIYKLADPEDYSFENGIHLAIGGCFI